MAGWTLVPCLVSLREEFDKLAPRRSKASDGSIGDPRHQQTASDHNPDETGRTPTRDADRVNEVHAIDVDKDLGSGLSMTGCVKTIVTRHRTGQDDRLQYVIWNRTIWSASWGWTARAYTGANPHTGHAHFSARYTTAAEKGTKDWGLLVDAKKPPVDAPIHKPGSRTLTTGMTGTDVAYAQRWLGLEDDGVYGPKTAAKVKAYQRMRGVAADGVLGPVTWREMGVR